MKRNASEYVVMSCSLEHEPPFNLLTVGLLNGEHQQKQHVTSSVLTLYLLTHCRV